MNEEIDTRTKTKGVKKEKGETGRECAPVCAYVSACLYMGVRGKKHDGKGVKEERQRQLECKKDEKGGAQRSCCGQRQDWAGQRVLSIPRHQALQWTLLREQVRQVLVSPAPFYIERVTGLDRTRVPQRGRYKAGPGLQAPDSPVQSPASAPSWGLASSC